MASNTVLAKMAVQISANTAEFNRSLSATQKNLASFTGGITKIAGTLGVAFGTQQVAEFALEVSKLAGEAEGVRAAFERLPNSTKLMQDLKEATGGTVSELGLMKRAVQASNFEISLEALPKLLEFATLRAQQTGQSVDYLVDSIVTGIGRKSKLILDNLGISAVQLDEALGGASTAASSIGEVADAVGKIAESNLKNMAGFSENASTKLQRLEATWVNVKVAIGNAANGTGILGTAIDSVTEKLDYLASKDLTFLDKLSSIISPGGEAAASAKIALELVRKENEERKKQAQIISEVDRYFKEFNGDIEAYGKTIETHIYRTELLAEFTKRLTDEEKKHVETLQTLKAKLEELNATFETTNVNDKAKLINIGDEIRATQNLIDELENLKIARLSSTAKRSIADTEPLTKVEGISGENFLSDVGILPVADQIEEATKRIDTALINNQQSVDSWGESMRISADLAAQQFQRNAALAESMGSAIGEAFGEAAFAQKSFADILKNLVAKVISLYAGQAIAAMTAAGAEHGAQTGNPYLAIAGIGAGLAIVSSAISKASSAAGAGSSSSGTYQGGRGSGANTAITSRDGNRIQFDAKFRIEGNDLVAIVNDTSRQNGRLRG
jgi:hypothetical protein